MAVTSTYQAGYGVLGYTKGRVGGTVITHIAHCIQGHDWGSSVWGLENRKGFNITWDLNYCIKVIASDMG